MKFFYPLTLLCALMWSCKEDDPASQVEDFDENAVIQELSNDAPDLANLLRRGWQVTQADVKRFSDDETIGVSYLVRYRKGVLTVVKSNDLEPGEAVTLWWVLFNNPENCTDGCGSDDFRTESVRADVMYADGEIIDNSGKRLFVSHRKIGDLSGSMASILFEGEARGIEDSFDTEVHAVLRTHGQVIPGLEDAMTGTFNGGCQGFPPEAGEPGPNTCANIQFSIHLP